MLKLRSFFDEFDRIERQRRSGLADASKRYMKKNNFLVKKHKRLMRKLKRIEYRRTLTSAIIRSTWHPGRNDDEVIDMNFNSLRLIRYSKRVARVYRKLKLKRRLLVIFINNKNNKFEYRKRKEERLFYKKLVRNLKICMTHPFITKRRRGPIFFTKLPTQVRPIESTDIMIRRRFSQPIFVRSVLKLSKPHNGLRKRRRRRL